MEAKRKMTVRKSQLNGLIMRKNELETLILTGHIKWKMERENHRITCERRSRKRLAKQE